MQKQILTTALLMLMTISIFSQKEYPYKTLINGSQCVVMLADQLAKDNQVYSDQRKELDRCKEESTVYIRNKIQCDSAINSFKNSILILNNDIKDFRSIESDKNKVISLKDGEINNLNTIIKDQAKICRRSKFKFTIGGLLIGIVSGIVLQSHI